MRAEGLPRLAFRCSPYHTTSALYSVITHVEHLLQFESDDSPATRLAKLEAGLRLSGLPLAEVVPLLAGLLAVPLPAERSTALTLTPQQPYISPVKRGRNLYPHYSRAADFRPLFAVRST